MFLRRDKPNLQDFFFIKQYQKCLDIETRVVGHEHPDVASSKHNLGLVHKEMGKLSEAKQLFTEAAEIRRKVLSADHHLTKKSEKLAAT